MPSQALVLALAASIYPPAVAAVIALGRGEEVRSRVFAFVLASWLVTYAVGTLVLYALVELGATGSHHLTPGAWVDVVLGVLLLLLALRLRLRRGSPIAAAAARVRAGRHSNAAPAPVLSPHPEVEDANEQSKIERYLHSRRLAFVLGIVLYALPSPIYIGAVKSIADANLSTSGELAALVVVVAIMLWMVELPMLMLLAVPDRAASTLESINLWFARHGRSLAILAALAVGVYLIVKGLARLA
jgi:hypothetical protein